MKQWEIINLQNHDCFADGVAVKKVGELTFKTCRDYGLETVLVENESICHELIELYQQDGIIVEPAGAVSVAALPVIRENDIQKVKGKRIVLVISGGNNDLKRYSDYMERLRGSKI